MVPDGTYTIPGGGGSFPPRKADTLGALYRFSDELQPTKLIRIAMQIALCINFRSCLFIMIIVMLCILLPGINAFIIYVGISQIGRASCRERVYISVGYMAV